MTAPHTDGAVTDDGDGSRLGAEPAVTDAPQSPTEAAVSASPTVTAAETTDRSGPVAVLLGLVLTAWPYLVAAGISLAVAVWAYRPWAFGQAVTRPDGDSLAFHAWVQNTIEGGWYELGERLSAPFVQNSHSYTMTDELVFALVGKVLAPLTGSAGSAVGWWVTLGFPAAAVAAVALARHLGISQVASIIPGVAFSILPDHFVRGTGHFALGTTWVIPVGLLAVVSLVHRPRHTGRRRIAFEVMLLVGLVCVTMTSAYYGVFTGILLVAAGGGAFWAHRRWGDLGLTALRGAALGVPLVVAVALDRLYSASPLGYESFVLTRTLADAELYGGKVTAMLLPAASHRVPALKAIRYSYDLTFAGAAEGPALGLVAGAGFVGLVLWAVLSHWHPRSLLANPVLATLAGLTWVALFAYVVGGLGTLWALALDGGGIRVWSRMHVFIALLALLAVGVTLDRLRVWWRAGLVALLLAVVVFDQTSPALRPDPGAARAVETEVRDLTARIATDAGADAAIFQYPAVSFPIANRSTTPASAYDGFLPYVYSEQLRWSYGGLQGDPTADWQLELAKEPLAAQVALIRAAGFSGLLVDTTTLAGTPEQLAEVPVVLGTPTLQSTSGRWQYFAFTALPSVCAADAGTVAGDLAARPPLLYGGPGIETSPGGLANREGDGALRIVTVRDGGWDDVTAVFTLDSATHLRVHFPDGSTQDVVPGVTDVQWTGDVVDAETPIRIERTGGPGPYLVTGLDATVKVPADASACLRALEAAVRP